MPDLLADKSNHIQAYLWFLFHLATSGYDQLVYMMEKRIVMRLIDFFLENESPQVTIAKGKARKLMSSNYVVPPLDNLILTVSFIARQQPYIDLTTSKFEDEQ